MTNYQSNSIIKDDQDGPDGLYSLDGLPDRMRSDLASRAEQVDRLPRVRPAFAAGEAPPPSGPAASPPPRPGEHRLVSKRYVVLARQSSTKPGSTSVDDQVGHLRRGGDGEGGTYAGALKLIDTRGSLPGKRKDFELLRRRKAERDDFDAVLVYVPDRWTRAGLLHGFGEEYLLRRMGVRVYFGDEHGLAKEEDEWGETKRALLYSSAKAWARGHSHRVCGALGASLLEGRRASRSSTPFGCDKLLRSQDGVPLYRLRDLRDGRTQKLTVDGSRVIDTYARGEAPRKRRTDLVEFVPGDEIEQRAVLRLYELRHRDGLGAKRIGRRLKEEQFASFNGEPWTEWRVADLLNSSIYIGKTYGFVQSCAIFNEQSVAGPKAAVYDEDELFSRSQPRTRRRDPSEWVVQDHPAMRDFLPEEIRRAAEIEQDRRRKQRYESSLQPPRAHTGGGSKHKGSQYLLTGLLHTTEGYPMSGLSCGPTGKTRRVYRTKRSCRVVEARDRLRTQIAAEPLEGALYEALSEALLAYAPDLEEHLAALLAEELEHADDDAAQLARASERRDEVRERIESIVESFDPSTLQEAQGVIARLKQQAASFDAEIAKLKATKKQRGFKPKQVAAEMVAQLRDLSTGWPQLPPKLAKDAAAALLSKAEVDLDTRAATFELALPDWAALKPKPKEGKDKEDKKDKKDKKEKKPKLVFESPSLTDASAASADGQETPKKTPTLPPGPLCLVGESGIRRRDETQQARRPDDRRSPSLLARVRCRYRRGGHGRPTSYRCRCARPLTACRSRLPSP